MLTKIYKVGFFLSEFLYGLCDQNASYVHI